MMLRAFGNHILGDQVVVKIIDLPDVERHIPNRFQRGAVVVEYQRLARRLPFVVELTANRHVPGTVDQRVSAVIDVLRSDIQTFPGGDGRRRASFGQIIQRADLQSDMVTINAPAARVG